VVTEPTVFHGTEQEKTELLIALEHNCQCHQEQRCAAHAMLLDQRTLDRLVFARRELQIKLVVEEFTDAA
jgi:uncharacterized protein YggL (DUF469 family)